jgi:tetratricopeptide (TPR) repeat protein
VKRLNTILVLSIFAFCVRDLTAAEGELDKAASWNWPTFANIQNQLDSYLDLINVPGEKREIVSEKWESGLPDMAGPAALDHLMEIVTLVEPRLSDLVDRLSGKNNEPIATAAALDLSWFDSTTPEWLQSNIRLAVGRYLAQNRLYDEALDELAAVKLDDVIDPSSVLFYRAVCQHHLLNRDECLDNVSKLLERDTEVVRRYVVTAKIMSADIQPMKADSIDEVARLMNDVERRLDLGRTNEKVIDEEKKIVDKLDKLIEKIEEQIQQQQQQQQMAQSQPQDSSQSQPMDGSKVAGSSGPGDVDSKDIGKASGWGDLPPLQRQESLQNITKDLPSHYSDVIEAYFRRIGSGKSEG